MPTTNPPLVRQRRSRSLSCRTSRHLGCQVPCPDKNRLRWFYENSILIPDSQLHTAEFKHLHIVIVLCRNERTITLTKVSVPPRPTLNGVWHRPRFREARESVGKREQQEVTRHSEGKQTQISAVYLISASLIFTVALGAVVIGLTGVRGRPLHFPWNLCLAQHWKQKHGAEIRGEFHLLPFEQFDLIRINIHIFIRITIWMEVELNSFQCNKTLLFIRNCQYISSVTGEIKKKLI